jgi:molybdopterin synthase sulfur carrier subunit
MPRIFFTPNLQRHVEICLQEVPGHTVREVLDQVFTANTLLQGYILDDQGALRKHLVIFVDGFPVTDRAQLSNPVPPSGEIWVMQALSGG